MIVIMLTQSKCVPKQTTIGYFILYYLIFIHTMQYFTVLAYTHTNSTVHLKPPPVYINTVNQLVQLSHILHISDVYIIINICAVYTSFPSLLNFLSVHQHYIARSCL